MLDNINIDLDKRKSDHILRIHMDSREFVKMTLTTSKETSRTGCEEAAISNCEARDLEM